MSDTERIVRFIDLFAGLGGIRIGFQAAFRTKGIETKCVFSSEIKPYAIAAYKTYFDESSMAGDITKIKTNEIPDFDYLLAGFPCQPFSSAGKQRGFLDTRGTLFFEIERILSEKKAAGKPVKGFLLENVEGLMNHDHGNTLKTIYERLSAMGYEVSYRLLDSEEFGLPQSRLRVYIVGTLREKIKLDGFDRISRTFKDIMQTGLPTVDDDFTRRLLDHYSPEELAGKCIKDKRGGPDNIHSWDLEIKGPTSPEQRALLNELLKVRRQKRWADEIGIEWMDGMPLTASQIRTFHDCDDLEGLLDDLVGKGYLAYEHPKKKDGAGQRVYDETKPKGYNIVAGRLSFEFSKIIDPDGLAPTLVATDVSRLGVIDGKGIRRLSIRESQRLCGFPEDYDLSFLKETDAYDLLGNTVCIPVIEAISERIADCHIRYYGDSEP